MSSRPIKNARIMKYSVNMVASAAHSAYYFLSCVSSTTVTLQKRQRGKLTADFDLERPRLGVAHVVVGGPTLDPLAVQISVK